MASTMPPSFGNDSLTWASGDVLAAPALSKVVLLGGNDLTVKVGTFSSNNAVGGTTSVAVPFLADIILVAGTGNIALDTATVTGQLCIGAAIQLGGTVTQATMGHVNVNNSAAGNMGAVVDSRYACAHTFGGTLGQAVELGTVTSSGFVATTRVATGVLLYGYVALKFNGAKIPFLQVINSPTAPGVATTAIPGVVPEFALLLMSLAQTTNTLENDADANGVAVGCSPRRKAARSALWPKTPRIRMIWNPLSMPRRRGSTPSWGRRVITPRSPV